MSKYQVLKNTVESSQPGSSSAPILYSTTELNEKGFKALLGRKVKSRPLTAIVIVAIIILAISTASTIVFNQAGAPTFAAFVPMFVVFFFYRTTLITVNDKGIDFYFIDAKRGSKYVVYDKMSLPYDKITDVNVKTGRFNTSITFVVPYEGKQYKIKTTVPNKQRKMTEQAENLKQLLEVLKKTA